MKLNQTEIDKVILLDPIKRYNYFLKKIADNELLYTLINEKGNYVVSVIDNIFILPLWSSPDFASLCQIKGWDNYTIREITLEEFEDNVVNHIEENKYLLNVFPVYDKTGFVLDLEEFIRDLNEELENYL